ncbi:MAG: glycosyltransferase [Bacteroidetes bacterium]|nr:glycosyltransferase [Bacteroidota bacterium]MCL1968095.1 glycosyltransferase [Bacteroidota bacterium]
MEKLNILFITSSDVSPLNGGIDRVVILLAEELNKLPQYQVFSAYFEIKHTSANIFKKKIKVDEKNMLSELSDFIRENEINIILNNVLERKKLKFLLPALEKISKQEHTCKILYHYHNLPGFEKASIYPKMYWMRLKNGQYKLHYFYKLMLQLMARLTRNKLLIRYWVKKYRALYQFSDKIVLLSRAYIPVFANCAQVSVNDKLVAINNPLSFSESIKIDSIYSKQKEALIVSRLDEEQKRLSLALKIWKKIESNALLSEWKLTIVGDGEDKLYYQNLVKKLKLQRVFFEGAQNPEIYYKRSSIFIMTSAYEGWGLTLTEAQQMGVVPVAFDTFGAVHDIIEDKYNGLIIPNNDIERYADKLAWLMQHDEERQTMACNAVESSKKFHPSEIGKQWVKLLFAPS